MSEYQTHHEDDSPRFEPWLGVMGASLVPAALVMFFPSLMIPLVTTALLLFAGGAVMLRSNSARGQPEAES